ncbi:MAG TPA: cation:proton antiporter [Candidatus Deferrimicrobiaceae bacterium]|nr:cation:proton antiporter [Candidatus Deferrimicrobiaceae bacterium]
MPHDVTLLRDIALGIVFAALLGHVARLLRQPLLLGYIAGGIWLSPQMGFGLITNAESIELISEIGLILLLFIIGLEIDLRELGRLGRSMMVLGVGQFAINSLLGLAFFAWLGYRVADGRFDLVYLAIVISLSSTLIVVKLLREKFELKILSGRLTLGVLVVQDIWAILFMAVQPSLAEPGVLRIAQSIAGGAVLVGVAFLASRYLLAPLLEASARRPELVLISSVAWCFGIAGFADQLGLSREMGALIAGVSISAFPYGADVISKVTGVRDFFVTLFFVALGLKVPVPTADVLGQALLIVVFVLASRVISVVPTAYVLGDGLYAGTVTALNLAQISEFSLVILTLGAGYGHVSERVGAVVLTAMILTSLLSPYLITWNDHIARWLVRPFERAPGVGGGAAPAAEARPARDIVLLGHFRIAQAVLDLVEAQAPQLKARITLVDYDVNRAHGVRARGFRWEYGDLANPDALEHLGIEEARIVVTTISDTFLKGISTRRLVGNLRRLAPRAVIVMTGEEKTDMEDLLRAGADHVLIPGEITGERILDLLRDGAA